MLFKILNACTISYQHVALNLEQKAVYHGSWSIENACAVKDPSKVSALTIILVKIKR